MKKLLYVILSLLLCVGAIGGTVVVAKHLTDKIENEPPMDESTGANKEIILKEDEMLLTDPDDFRTGETYRFYIDKSNPESEAYIVLNLVTGDGGFNGGYTEPKTTVELDMPKVTIGVSTSYDKAGYIYWKDGVRLSVDAEVSATEEYFEIVLDENVFTGAGDNATIPSIWFELIRDTKCLEVVTKGDAYIVVVDSEQADN